RARNRSRCGVDGTVANSVCHARRTPCAQDVAEGATVAGPGGKQKAMTMAAERDLVKTGIDGLDDILSGGLLRGSVVLIEGTAGTGKTTLGVEFIYHGATLFDEPGLIVLFEVSPDKLVRDAALLGWDLPALERQGR